jgi:hypothetical protein
MALNLVKKERLMRFILDDGSRLIIPIVLDLIDIIQMTSCRVAWKIATDVVARGLWNGFR